MSTTTTTTERSHDTLAPLEMPARSTRVPSLDELRSLTNIPERRIVFRNVDWAFYDRLVDSIPESSNIHVDYDGNDLEVMGNGPDHEWIAESLGSLPRPWPARPAFRAGEWG